MIDRPTACSRESRRLWAGHIRRLFETLELDDRCGADDISQSLAAYCEQHNSMSRPALSLLAARSFCATGDSDAAARILRHDRLHRPYAESWMEVLPAEYPFPGLYPLFSSRVLRPVRFATVGRQAAWVLDLSRITLTESDRHEMIFMQTLRTLAENISNVWKKPRGQGTLIVKGCMHMPCSPAETAGYIQDVLHRCAVRNHWASIPSVLLIGL
jgi:hypothetical protein